jgi:hypothetical protein
MLNSVKSTRPLRLQPILCPPSSAALDIPCYSSDRSHRIPRQHRGVGAPASIAVVGSLFQFLASSSDRVLMLLGSSTLGSPWRQS